MPPLVAQSAANHDAGRQAQPFLTPDRVSKMLQRRRSFQIVKFRTNYSDCVPNL
jgi:hypothetical protein